MQFGADAAGIGGRAAVAVRADAVQRAGDDAGGRGLADAAHAGEHEGMRDAAGGEGVAQGAHHRFLADQVVETGRAVFAREHAVGRSRRRLARAARRRTGRARQGGSASAVSSWNRPDMRAAPASARGGGLCRGDAGWEADKRPEREPVAAASFRT